MKKWLVNRLIRVDDFIEYAETLPLEEKRKVLTKATKRLFNTVDSDDLLKDNRDGTFQFGRRTLTREETDLLRKKAEALRDSMLFKVLDKECKYHCNLRMRKAKTLEELDTAKSIEFAWDVIKTRLNNM